MAQANGLRIPWDLDRCHPNHEVEFLQLGIGPSTFGVQNRTG